MLSMSKYILKHKKQLVLSFIIVGVLILIYTFYSIFFKNKTTKTTEPFGNEYVVYCCWTGNNPMSEARQKCFDTIKKNIGCKVVLITPTNLNEYITPEYPLHKAYEYLSYTHKADYLRTYMLHVHGGGYTDIKETTISWRPYFELLENSPDKWAIGYKEVGAGGVACGNCDEVVKNWEKLIGNGAYIFKKQTPLTTEWFRQMNAKLDEKYEALKANPAQAPDDVPGKEITLPDGQKIISKYPMYWAEMLGGIFHPVCYKYHDRLLNTLPAPKFSDYR